MRLSVLQHWSRRVPPAPDLHAVQVVMTHYTTGEIAEELARGLVRLAQIANAYDIHLGRAVAVYLGQAVAHEPPVSDGTA